MSQGFSRRHFFYGTLLAGAVPTGGFGSTQSLTKAGYRSPNEKLNLAAIGAGGQPASDLRDSWSNGAENVVALTDVDWVRGQEGFERFPKAAKYKDFRQMLDKSGKEIDAVVIGTSDHMHTYCAVNCMAAGKHVYVEKPLTRLSAEARVMYTAAEKYKVATQMGNQGYSHDATRVACEIIWSGEIGDVTEVHGFQARGSWPQGMTRTPPPTPVPDTLDWDLWLGTAEFRPYTAGDEEYKAWAAESMGRGRPAAAGPGGPPAGPGGAAGAGAAAAGAARGAAAGGRAGGGGGMGGNYGYYNPFNWRGFYDFGSSLIGDWGVHILGPANWGLALDPKYLVSVECVRKDPLPSTTFPWLMSIRYDFAARGSMPPVSVYWHQGYSGGDPYTVPGIAPEDVRKIPGTGPQVGPQQGQGGFFMGGGQQPGAPGRGGAAPGGAPGAPGAPGAQQGRGGAQQAGGRGPGGGQGSGYNCIFVGSKGYMGTSGRGEGVGLIPGARWAEYKLPAAYLPRSPGASTGDNHSAHCRDWVRACKGGAPACSNFSIGGRYTEWLVLGSAAIHAEGKLMWDNTKGEFTNNKEVNKWVKPTYRKGWEVKV
jgi:hypothetical protein